MSSVDYITNTFDKSKATLSEMDLMEILYNQDIDMGVSRDLYDPLYLEKQQKELELQQERKLQMEKLKLKQEAGMYTIDAETGERIFTSSSPVTGYQSQLSKESLSRDLEELSEMINFDNTELDSYLKEANTTTNYSSLLQQDVNTSSSSWTSEPLSQALNDQTSSFMSQMMSNNDTQYSSPVTAVTPPNTNMPQMEYSSEQQSTFTDMDFDMMMTSGGDDQGFTYSQEDSLTDFQPFIFSSAPVNVSQDGMRGQAGTPNYSDNSSEHSQSTDSSKSSRSKRSFCRDELKCKQLDIPFPVETITNCPVDEFNSLLKNNSLNEEQVSLIRDIRRRGKNKVAAQNCRKKKVHELTGLEGEIEDLKRRRTALLRDKAIIQKNKVELEAQVNQTYAEVFNSLTDVNGRTYDPRFYRLHITDDGEPHIVPTQAFALPALPTPYMPSNMAAYTLLDLSMKA